jgi:hypothetical protein
VAAACGLLPSPVFLVAGSIYWTSLVGLYVASVLEVLLQSGCCCYGLIYDQPREEKTKGALGLLLADSNWGTHPESIFFTNPIAKPRLIGRSLA